MKQKLFKWLTLLFYQQWVKSSITKKPVGIPGNRDPDAECEIYMPIKKGSLKFLSGDCETDGHYLCDKCIHNIKNSTYAKPTEEN